MKKFLKILITGLTAIIGSWIILTLWAESAGENQIWQIGETEAARKAIVIFDPDPFYNLDEQVCQAFGQVLAEHDIQVTIATVTAANEIKNQWYDLYVFCANTYNWRPDWAISGFIKKHPSLKNKSVVAITLGAGSTGASQRAFEKIIVDKEAQLLDSRSFWLLRPNDESRMDEKNVQVAVSMAAAWAGKIAKLIKAPDQPAYYSDTRDKKTD